MAENTDGKALKRKDLGGTAMPNLTFSDLIPDRLTFTDDLDGGKVYEFITETMLNAEEYNHLKRLQRAIDGTIDSVTDADKDDADAAKRLDKAVDEMLALILPDWPQERRATLKLGQKAAIIQFWTEESNFGERAERERKQAVAERVNEGLQEDWEAQQEAAQEAEAAGN
jgi:hypothetical protein